MEPIRALFFFFFIIIHHTEMWHHGVIALFKSFIYLFIHVPRISSVEEMARTGMYMSDLGMYDSSQEMVLSGIQPLPELEYARDQV